MSYNERQKSIENIIQNENLAFNVTCGGSGKPLANVRKSVYAPGASSGGG